MNFAFLCQIYEPFLDLSLPLVDQKPARPTGSGKKFFSNGFNDEPDVSCFGRTKKSDDHSADEDASKPSKSKHQVGSLLA
jgi:hypothetical protein